MVGTEEDLFYAQLSFSLFGQEDRRWMVARDKSYFSPEDWFKWGFGSATYKDVANKEVKEISLSEIRALKLENLEHGIEMVERGICHYYTVLC